MTRRIKIYYTDFFSDFNIHNNYFSDLLSTRYSIELSDKPDFLIYSNWGDDYLKHKCTRVFYTGENIRPDFDQCDYAFTFDYIDDPRHYRLPLYGPYLGQNPYCLEKKDFDVERIADEKTKFCSFVVSSPRGRERYDFFERLSKYKKVDSGGRALNNIGGPVADKLAFIKDYKFTMCFENSSYPGYTTEKIIDAMRTNSLAIYWGNKLVNRDFNTRSFINYNDFSSLEDVVEHVIELDQDRYKYMQYLSHPYYNDNCVNEFIKPENILAQFERIFDSDRRPVARDPAVQAKILFKKVMRRLTPSSSD